MMQALETFYRNAVVFLLVVAVLAGGTIYWASPRSAPFL